MSCGDQLQLYHEKRIKKEKYMDKAMGMEAVLVHEPVDACAARRTANVEDKCLLHVDDGGVVHDRVVLPGGIPEPFQRCPLHSKLGWVFSAPRHEQVPLNFGPRIARAQ